MARPLNVSGLVQTGEVEGRGYVRRQVQAGRCVAYSRCHGRGLRHGGLVISQHDPYELTRAMAVISAQGWTITNGYNIARAVESLDVLASVFAEEAGIDRHEPPR
jgi:hypothetical protein